MTDDRNLPARGDEPRPPARGIGQESRGPGGAPAGAGHADEIELREILGVLRRRVGWVIAGVVLAVAVAGILIWWSVPEYRAEAALRVVNEREAMTAGLQAPGLDRALGRSADPLLSQVQVLRSRRVLGTVVDREGLRLKPASPEFPWHVIRDVVVEDPHRTDTLHVRFGPDGFHVADADARAPYGRRVEVGGLYFTVTDDPGVERAELVLRSRNEAVEWVEERLQATPRQETDVVNVRFTAHDPRLAQRVANTVMAVYRSVDRQSAQEEARRRRIFVEEQLQATDSLLAATQAELSAFRSREEIYSSRERLAAEQSGLFGLQVRREELAAQQRMLDRMLDRARAAGGEARDEAVRALVSSPGMAENPVVVQLWERLARAEAARDSLTEGEWGSAATNPDVARLDSLAAQTKRGILDAAASYVASLNARVEALDELGEQNAAALRTLPETESQEMRLVQRVETIRTMSDQLRGEYQRAQIEEAVEAGQVEILDAAVVPDQPVGTGTAMKLALALMLGLMLGSGAAFVREHLDTAIHQREDVERVLGLSPLGVVPRLHVESGARRLSLPGRGTDAGGARRQGAGDGISREVVALHDQKSSGAEAYRTLRTNLLFSQLGEALRTVVVTSAMEGEGKTTVASNLATTFAQQGVRVLLVDADLRKARLHETFGVDREPGLTECVLGRASVQETIRGTSVDGLHLLPAGTLPPNPSEVLGSDRMRRLLVTLREGFELVLFDSPPLLAAGDAAVLGARADGVVLVVRAGETDRGAAKEAVRQLELVRARILGAVLNDPDAVVGRYGGYYSYAYYGE